MKKSIYSILRGTFLVSDDSFKNWRIIIFISVLAIVMIASSHSADKKVYEIAKLKNVVANARIIDESQLDTSKILIHSIVKLKNMTNGMDFTYTLVADSESDVRNGKLSVNSPIGKGLLGKKVGEIAEIQVPNGIMKFEILEISR